MAFGIATSAMTATAALHNIPKGVLVPPAPSSPELAFAVSVLAAVVVFSATAIATVQHLKESQWAERGLELGTGAVCIVC
jgi:hypothetical protein